MIFFNIIINTIKHIHQIYKYSQITNLVFMKMQPFPLLHNKKHFVYEEVIQIM
jgi:hypothetical protein